MAASVVYTNFGGMLMAETRGGVEREYVPDTLGSLIAEIDSNQVVTSRLLLGRDRLLGRGH